MVSVDLSIQKQLTLLRERCPVLCPSIFPTSFSPTSLDELCASSDASSVLRTWSKSMFTNELTEVSFRTSLSLENTVITIDEIKAATEDDSLLHSVDKILTMILTAPADSMTRLYSRFAEINGVDATDLEARQYFVESYHLAYALRVTISNIPGLRICLNGVSLPLRSREEAIQAVSRFSAKGTAGAGGKKKKKEDKTKSGAVGRAQDEHVSKQRHQQEEVEEDDEGEDAERSSEDGGAKLQPSGEGKKRKRRKRGAGTGARK